MLNQEVANLKSLYSNNHSSSEGLFSCLALLINDDDSPASIKKTMLDINLSYKIK
jgi:hypothetical protein